MWVFCCRASKHYCPHAADAADNTAPSWCCQAKNGVQAITVGENGACAPVAVPPIFVWRDEPSNSSVLAMFHPRGYGRRRNRRGLQEDGARLASLYRIAMTVSGACRW
jgi:hypothetical protein